MECAAELGLAALALTDRDGLYGAVRFATRARQRRLDAIIGSELSYADGARIVLLVETSAGYGNLCELISRAQARGSKGDARLLDEDFIGRTEGLIALSGGEHGRIERAFARRDAEAAEAEARRLQQIFGDAFFLELQHHLTPDDAQRCAALLELGDLLGLPCVATNGVVYARKDDAQLADIVRCIARTTCIHDAREKNLLRPNAEYHLKDASMMRHLFSGSPEALRNTMRIAERCTFRLERLTGQFPLFAVPDGFTRQTYLRTLVGEGAKQRYGAVLSAAVERQLEYELGIIAKMDLAGYFLIVWDIVRAANELGVLCQGRGSAANSAVCYTLGITAIDPVGMGLLFERFLSEERQEIPDIDIDFAHQDRERVIQYIYERYGRGHAAMAAEVISYRTRSALRDIGKALGLSLERVDAIVREYDAGAPPDDVPEHFVMLCEKIRGFPRHMGIHSGGMVITRDPLVRVAPVEWASMRDRSVLQWDKDDLQELGLIKIDLLGLGMLSLLREAFAIHARVYGGEHPLALHTIPADDPPTYAMMTRADTIGVFQIESRAQQSMLPRMKPRCFYDIVMQVAIIRPGPIQGQMIHPFLRRREGLEAVEYPHPRLRPILERTLGVPLFQEQGMRLAIEAAGFSAGEADRLRRAMGHKRSHERMDEIHASLVEGMVRNDIDREAAERLFAMLEGFADYGFPESHAASFALLAYASAYVKCHFPAIFSAAILNVQPMGFYSTEVLVNDAKRHEVTIKSVAVNASEFFSYVDGDGALRLGYHLVRDIGSVQRERIERALAGGTPFRDLDEFIARTQLDLPALESLAAAGAFQPWYAARRDALWALRAACERRERGALAAHMDVAEPPAVFSALPAKTATALDLWSIGLTPGVHAISHFRTQLDARRVLAAQQLPTMPNNLICRVGGMVITRQKPATAKGFVFLTLEDETGLINIIVRPDVYERYRRVVRSNATLVIEGKLQKQSGSIDVLARKIWTFDGEGLVDGVRARNFH